MSRRPEVKELQEAFEDIVYWENVATHLRRVKQSDIEVIKKQKEKPTEQKRELFNTWLKRCPTASWNDVREALNKAGEFTPALVITKKYNLTTLATPKEETEETDSVCIAATEQEREKPLALVPPMAIVQQQESDEDDSPVDIN